MAATNGESPSAALTSNVLRELFTDLMAYVMNYLATWNRNASGTDNFRAKVIDYIESANARGENKYTGYTDARFAVICWIDEMVLTSEWCKGQEWDLIAMKYHHINTGGEDFFDRLDKLDPSANDVREIYYLCLCLGFRGMYAAKDQQASLDRKKTSVHDQLRKAWGATTPDHARLFPEAYPPVPRLINRNVDNNWAWYVAALAIPLLIFIVSWWYLYTMRQGIEAPQTTIQPQAVPVQDWSTLLKELRDNKLDAVDETLRIRVPISQFEINQTALSSQAKRDIQIVADLVRKFRPSTELRVVGHASLEGKQQTERDKELSNRRAEVVMYALRSFGYPENQITAEGVGTAAATIGNPSLNRRAEIIIIK